MEYKTRRAGTTRNRRCDNFCANVCNQFSSGRGRCVRDCLACRRRALKKRNPRVLPIRQVPCGCR